MRRLLRFGTAIGALLALLASSESSAVPYSLYATSDYDGVSVLAPGDTVDVSIFLDAEETGITLLSVGVQFDETVFAYLPRTLAQQGVPSYILYGGSGTTASWLQAQQDPWALWPGTVPDGLDQVNVYWADPSFLGTQTTGTGIKIGEIRLQVVATGDGIGEIIALDNDPCGGQICVPLPPNLVAGTPIYVNTPEPGTALLLGAGLLALGVTSQRARR